MCSLTGWVAIKSSSSFLTLFPTPIANMLTLLFSRFARGALSAFVPPVASPSVRTIRIYKEKKKHVLIIDPFICFLKEGFIQIAPNRGSDKSVSMAWVGS